MLRDDIPELADPLLAAAVTEKAAQVLALLRESAITYSPVAFANSLGAEDMLLTDLIFRNTLDIDIFSLDTGRLPVETYELIGAVEKRYGHKLDIYFPRHEGVESFVREHGINGFYESVELRKACCQVRKLEPLRRALAGKKAWITGLRAAQSTTREQLETVAFDAANRLTKISPLADWSETEVWAYLHMHDVPTNPLHRLNYPSIGCAPCTRAIQPGEDVRAGRWWWENPETKECGLHMVDGRLQRTAKQGVDA
jgi:phosphoadenosine phosphosulfate reductase